MISVGFLNTGLPIGIMSTLALILPRVFAPSDTRSHRAVLSAVVLTVVALLFVGAALLALLYKTDGAETLAAARHEPVGTARFLLERSGLMAIVWIPLLALSWFGLAQRVERLRGEDLTPDPSP